MATLDSFTRMNIVEANRREGYTSSLSLLANLAQKNDLMNFAPWKPASNGMFHKYLQAKKLGKGAMKQINGPVATMASQTVEQIEPICMYEGDSPVDEDLLRGLSSEAARKARDSEDVMNFEGGLQDWNSQFVYGSSDPNNGFKGLMARRSKLAVGACYTSGGNSANSQSSLLLFEFGENGFNFRYAPGMAPGIQTEDRGRHYITAPTGTGNYWAWVRHMVISGGMEIKAAKALLRLANIESTLSTDNFIKMKNQLPNVGRDAMGFANRTVHALIETNAYNKTNMAFSLRDIEGFGPVTMIVGIPIMMMDAITDTEAVVS